MATLLYISTYHNQLSPLCTMTIQFPWQPYSIYLHTITNSPHSAQWPYSCYGNPLPHMHILQPTIPTLYNDCTVPMATLLDTSTYHNQLSPLCTMTISSHGNCPLHIYIPHLSPLCTMTIQFPWQPSLLIYIPQPPYPHSVQWPNI